MNYEQHKAVADAATAVFEVSEALEAAAETRLEGEAAAKVALALGELEAVAAKLRMVVAQMQPAYLA